MTATATPEHVIPDLPGFATHYGVRICNIGDDGDMVMLGHVDDRTAVAVARAYLRSLQSRIEADLYLDGRLGRDPWDYQRAWARDALSIFEPVKRKWAVRIKNCDRWPACQEPHADCGNPAPCQEIQYHDWWLDCDASAGQPGAFPISYWAE